MMTPNHLRATTDAHSPWCGAEVLDQKFDEGPHLGSLMTARRQQRVQWVGFRILRLLQQGLQEPLMDGPRHHVLAQPQDASSSNCQLQEHIRAISADGTFDIDPGQLAIDSKGPARRAGISAQGQARVTNKIRRFDRPAMLGEVAWGCAHDPGDIDDLARDEPGVLEALEREVRANLVYRDFTRLGGAKMPDAKTTGRWGVTLGPQVIAQIHERMVTIAKDMGGGEGAQHAHRYHRG